MTSLGLEKDHTEVFWYSLKNAAILEKVNLHNHAEASWLGRLRVSDVIIILYRVGFEEISSMVLS